MFVTKVQLDTIAKVKDFVNIVNRLECNLDLATDRFVVDAKSILGIFSIDLSRPIDLRIHDGAEHPQAVMDLLKDYIVTE